MNQRRILFGLLFLPMLASCTAATRPLQIEPARRATPIAPKFTSSYYYYDRDQAVYFVMRSHANDPGTGKPVDQIATMRVFWRPKGGVTTMDPSALNTTLRYIVMTPDAVGMYEGAGFVRLNSKTGNAKMNARLMDADMHLTQYSKGFVDSLGRAHMNGTFTAMFDDAKAVDMMLDAQREFFARSLEGKAATQPGGLTLPTMPTAPVVVPGISPAITLPAVPATTRGN